VNKNKFGFTLIEVLVVIAIFGILSAVLYANFGEAGAQSRDTERKADLRALQSALELYKLKNGRYPAGCNAPGRWSGQAGTSYACPSGSQYIVGLAPEFIPVLPSDGRLNGSDSGYVYTTNADGTVYKLMARRTVESETITDDDHEFKSCDINLDTGLATCDETHPTGNRPSHCDPSSPIYQTSYGVWGGFAHAANATQVDRLTEDLICEIP